MQIVHMQLQHQAHENQYAQNLLALYFRYDNQPFLVYRPNCGLAPTWPGDQKFAEYVRLHRQKYQRNHHLPPKNKG